MTNTPDPQLKATAREALDAVYAAIVRQTAILPLVDYDTGSELAGLANLAATLHHQAELEGTAP